MPRRGAKSRRLVERGRRKEEVGGEREKETGEREGGDKVTMEQGSKGSHNMFVRNNAENYQTINDARSIFRLQCAASV